ncbi:MAG TPA: hypothetical protein VEZ20_05920 [Allosphingosinicella sp.]|nr:hypothetical protein [Allosphingosinicella sp.]
MTHWNNEAPCPHAAGYAAAPARGTAAARADHIDDYPPGAPFPWDDDPPPAPHDPNAPRVRHDAFTPRRRNEFLRALARLGCLADACRETGVAARTVYNHQQSDPDFLRLCNLAASMCATPVELTAWERGVTGVEEQFACGGKVYTRLRRSDHMLKLLLQASNPKKYGARPGFKRKRILKHERKEMEREVRAEFKARNTVTFDEGIEQLEKALQAFGQREEPKRFAEGWTRTPDGHWIPPGYGPLSGSPAFGNAEARTWGGGGIGGGGLGDFGGAERGGEPPCESM